jgi:hypothetical protein
VKLTRVVSHSCTAASSNCTAFSSYLGVFELFAVQCCAVVHFFVVIRTAGVSSGIPCLIHVERLEWPHTTIRIMTNVDYDPESIALAVAPKIPALLSIIGSSYIVYTVASDARKRKKIYHRIMLSLSCCDIIASTAYFLGTWMIPKGTEGDFGPVYGASGNDGTCTASGFVVQFAVASPLYNATLAFYFFLIFRYDWKECDMVKIEPILHGIPLCFAFGTAIAAAVLNLYGSVDWLCWINPDPPQPHIKIYQWAFLFGPIFICIVFISTVMILLYRAMRTLERNVEKYAFERSVALTDAAADNTQRKSFLSRMWRSFSSGSVTTGRNKKKNGSTEVAIQGMLYVGAFYITWFFPTLQRIIELCQTTRERNFALQFLDTFLLPLQGFFNAMIYFRPKFRKYLENHPELSCCQSVFRTLANNSESVETATRTLAPGSGYTKKELPTLDMNEVAAPRARGEH